MYNGSPTRDRLSDTQCAFTKHRLVFPYRNLYALIVRPPHTRSHGDLEARARNVSATGLALKAFVAMPIVHGPPTVKFNDAFPAKMRFFAGGLKEFLPDTHEEESGGPEVGHLVELATPRTAAYG